MVSYFVGFAQNVKSTKNHKDLKLNFDALNIKHNALVKKYDEIVDKKNCLKCNKCDEEFVSKIALQKHSWEKHRIKESFKCDDCDKQFDEVWELNAHSKNHKRYPFEHCDKTFRFKDIKEKHIKVSHE